MLLCELYLRLHLNLIIPKIGQDVMCVLGKVRRKLVFVIIMHILSRN